MKLVLANNQTDKFLSFFDDLQKQSVEQFDYAGYRSLLFYFNAKPGMPLDVVSMQTGKSLGEYNGIYINGYLNTYEIAASVAITCNALGIGYANTELGNPPSLTKLSMYAKLTAAQLPTPATIAGTKKTLLFATNELKSISLPAVLKRADAERGIDNYKVNDLSELETLLKGHENDSLWLYQEYIPNDGYYVITYYGGRQAFCIFRSLEERPDKNPQKAHMYKPKGGANASLVPLQEVPEVLINKSKRAIEAMDRQVASVDCLYNVDTQSVKILEVNYNPQMVTIDTFKDERVKAFLEYLPKIGNNS